MPRMMSKAGTGRPSEPRPDYSGRSTQYASTSDMAVDVYGRFYQVTDLPVFLTTGTRLVWDRMGNGTPGNTTHGGFVDIDSLVALADGTGHAWGATEIGMAPDWWLDLQEPNWGGQFQPGFGEGSAPTLPNPPSGTRYTWRAEFDRDFYETLPAGDDA